MIGWLFTPEPFTWSGVATAFLIAEFRIPDPDFVKRPTNDFLIADLCEGRWYWKVFRKAHDDMTGLGLVIEHHSDALLRLLHVGR